MKVSKERRYDYGKFRGMCINEVFKEVWKD